MEWYTPPVDVERGTITSWDGLVYGFTWSWSGVGRGRGALWSGDPKGPCFQENEFVVHQEAGGEPWVEWLHTKGRSRWRPDRDEDELDYVPKPDAYVWEALEQLILQGEDATG